MMLVMVYLKKFRKMLKKYFTMMVVTYSKKVFNDNKGILEEVYGDGDDKFGMF